MAKLPRAKLKRVSVCADKAGDVFRLTLTPENGKRFTVQMWHLSAVKLQEAIQQGPNEVGYAWVSWRLTYDFGDDVWWFDLRDYRDHEEYQITQWLLNERLAEELRAKIVATRDKIEYAKQAKRAGNL